MKTKAINIYALKYGDYLHYHWKSNIVELNDEFVLVKSKAGRIINHYTRGKKFVKNNVTIEFFPFNKWFTVSAEIKNGEIIEYYCNIAMPAKLCEDCLTFVDLDLDLVRKKNSKWKVIDEEDLKENMLKYSYPPYLVKRAKLEMDKLKKRIIENQIPFNGMIKKHIR